MANYTTSVLTPSDSAQSQGTGPTASLSGSNDPYSTGRLSYPLSGLGTDVPSYMVFYINLPTASKYFSNGGAKSPDQSAAAQNYNTLNSNGGTYKPANGGGIAAATTLTTLSSVFQNKSIPQTAIAAAGAAATAGLLKSLDLKPKLQRITQSIAIYMPDTVATTYAHTWNSVNATDAGSDIGKYAQLGGSFKGAVNDVAEIGEKTFKNVFSAGDPQKFNPAQSELAGDFAQKAGLVGEGFTGLMLKSNGRAVNPHTEMLYQQTLNRGHEFQFHFVPRSSQEAVAINNIIKTFKAFSHPEVSGDYGGRYYIPPGVFDIQFYFLTAQNPAISKISTCALVQMAVNYSGAGEWATFNDGAPLKIDLSLSFTEVDVLTRELIETYGY